MSQVHIPVLLNEVIESYASLKEKNDLVYFDGTFGRGGHFNAIQKNYSIQKAFIADQDLEAISSAKLNWNELIEQNKLEIFHMNFLDFARQNTKKLDMILLDLGVSSPQLDQAHRGFSFNKDGPLDMRMNQTCSKSAADLINELDHDELMHIFKYYGEVPNPFHVVKAIIQDRVTRPYTTTLQLSGLIERVDGWQKKGFNPATQYFMALRLAVNQELEVLEEAIPLLMQQLQDGGLFSIITFHSLEDRIVKNLFKENEIGFLKNKKVIVPTEEECRINVRSRSAKLRIFQKGKMPEKPDKFAARRALRETSS
ncbi:MAG: 16S rRNA (cytosine(1402)-N(4))-methyltransferase RsmH [Pseudobdellovibrio sp.]